MVQDLRFALRNLRKNPAFLAVAVLMLGLGIGANTAIFSVVKAVLLSPLDYPDPERIVAISTLWTKTSRESRLTGPDYWDVAAQTQSFAAAAKYFGGEIGVQVGEAAEFSGVHLVSGDFFRVFGVAPIAGRTIEENDESAAVVSAAFARRHFGTIDSALGQPIRVLDRPFAVAGVMPAGFHFPRGADVWLPAGILPVNPNRTAHNYSGVARLRAAVSIEAARSELNAIGGRLAREHPASNMDKSFTATPIKEQLVQGSRATLLLLMGAVGLVLLVACANMANLLLARSTVRMREMAVRAALGASRWRIVRQLAIESALVALIAGAAGLLLAAAGTRVLVDIAPPGVPRLDQVTVDGVVLVFALAVSLGASLIFGLAPAWRATRVELNHTLRQGCGRGTLAGGAGRLPGGLVVAEIALACALAAGAGLLFRSFLALNGAELGYRTEGVLVMYVAAPANDLESHKRATLFFRDLTPELEALPGVFSAAAAMGLPAGQYGSNGSYAVIGKHDWKTDRNLPQAGFRLATPGYFATMGIRLLRGRDIEIRDNFDAPPVAIISAALAEESFGGEDPIGRQIVCGLDRPEPMTIVGVVGDVRQDSPASGPRPELYMPVEQHPWRGNELQVVLRTAVEPGSVSAAARRVVHSRNPAAAVKFTTMRDMLAESIALPRFRTVLLGAFAALALLLAMAGVYGVMAYTVAQRTPEIGLRLALGALPGDILRMTLGWAIGLAALGLGAGLLLAVALTRAVRGMLFEVQPADPLTCGAVAVALVLATAAAALVPALRAARVAPIETLREE